MKCPNCSSENNEANKFCIACGHPLVSPRAKGEINAAPSDANRLQAAESKDIPTKDNGNAAATPHKNEPGREGGSKKLIYALSGLAAVAIIATIAIVAMLAIDNGPSDEQIKKAIQDEGFKIANDQWKTNDEAYQITNLEVIEKQRVDDTTGLAKAFHGTSTYYKVKAKATASNGAAECAETVETEFFKDSDKGEWEPSSLDEKDRKLTALRGINVSEVEKSVKEELSGKLLYGEILEKATQDKKLLSMYRDADVKITDEKFDKDAQTDTLTIALSKNAETATSNATVTAKFAFNKGIYGTGWGLDSASFHEETGGVNRQGLVGTWTGKFKEQSGVLLGGKCFGAQDRDVTLTISSLDNTTLKAEGTISFLAHYHKTLKGSNQNSTDGDTYLENQSFSTTFENNYNKAIEPNKGDVYASFEFSENSNGKTQFQVSFDDKTGEGSLRVTTSTGSFASPAFFEDVYTLTKGA